jgi:hypothetical protein
MAVTFRFGAARFGRHGWAGKAVKVRLGMARRVSARRSRYGSVRSGMSGRG